MKTALRFLLVLLIVFACSKKTESSGDAWPEMDSFHMIMAESYHPLKDSANLVPAKANAESLASAAEKWENASLPDKVNNDEVKALLAKLKTDSKFFAGQVKSNAPDSVLSAALVNLHDEFHKIMEAWHGGHESH